MSEQQSNQISDVWNLFLIAFTGFRYTWHTDWQSIRLLTPHGRAWLLAALSYDNKEPKIEASRQPNDNNGKILIENFNLATQRSLPRGCQGAVQRDGTGAASESASWLRFRLSFRSCRCCCHCHCRCHCPWLHLVQKDLRLGRNLPTIKCRNKTRNSALCECVYIYLWPDSSITPPGSVCPMLSFACFSPCVYPSLSACLLRRWVVAISCSWFLVSSFHGWCCCCCCIVQIYAHVLLPVSQILLHLFQLLLFIYKAKAPSCSESNCSLSGCHVAAMFGSIVCSSRPLSGHLQFLLLRLRLCILSLSLPVSWCALSVRVCVILVRLLSGGHLKLISELFTNLCLFVSPQLAASH